MPQRLQGRRREDLKEFEPIWETIEGLMGGFVPNSMFIMSHNIELMSGFGMLSSAVFRGSKEGHPNPLRAMWGSLRYKLKNLGKPEPEPITNELRYLVFTAVSLSSGCRYCQAHSAMLAGHSGSNQEKLDSILSYETSEHYSAAERAAVALAFAAGQVPNETTNDHFEELKKYYSDAQIIDIVAAIAYMGFLNRWNDTFSTTLEETPLSFASSNLKEVPWEVGKHASGEA
ncbi:MAG: carboxymuconolactone decarboxylase family protein [Pseudomonadota bacterium]